MGVNESVHFRGYTSSLQLINVDLTKGVEFNRDRYLNDGLEFYKMVNFSGLTTCRFNIFQVQVRGSEIFVLIVITNAVI